MLKYIIFIFPICILIGCSTTQKITVPADGITVIDYSANRRGAYVFKNSNGGQFIVSEPSPDVAKEITSSLGISAETINDIVKPELKAAYANKVIDLANRSQTLQVLRESLFRLSEMGVSSSITSDQRVVLYIKVLETIKMIAATEFAGSDASKEVKDKVLKDFFSDTGTNTIPIPTQ